MLKQVFVGAVLGLFYYLLQLAIRPHQYSGLAGEATRFLTSIGTGILIYMIIFLLRSWKPKK